MFFFTNVLLRCMYGRFFRSFISSDFVCGDRGFSKCLFFQSWASSCIDIDIVDSVVVVITSLFYSSLNGDVVEKQLKQ